MYNSVIFVIDNGKLDDLFLDSSKSEHLDYENINGDSFYSLPPKYYDRFVDWADSNGFQDGEDWYEVDTKGNQMTENKMKLTLKERKLIKEYAKKLIEERIPPNDLLKRIKRNVNQFKIELTKSGYKFDSQGRK